MNLKLAMVNLAAKWQTPNASFTIPNPVSTVITNTWVRKLIFMVDFQQDYTKLKHMMEDISIFKTL